MTRSRLILLDANVVIQLHRMRVWSSLRTRYRIALTQAVRDESKFFERPDGAHERIDLAAEIDAGEVELIEVTPKEFARFQARFDPGYVERLDDGECESLAYLTQNTNAVECAVCSADKIVWRVLGNLHLREHGISLEEMLTACGLTAAVPAHYSKAFREEWTRKGFTEGLQGIGKPWRRSYAKPLQLGAGVRQKTAQLDDLVEFLVSL